MNRKTMSVLLRALLIFLVLLAVLFFFFFLPFYGSELARVMPEYAWAYYPCLVWAWVFALPLFLSVLPAWRVFGTIREKNAPFSVQNAKRFRKIAICLSAAGFLFPAGVIVMALLGAGSAPLTLICTPLVFFGMNALGFVCYVMNRLILEAAAIREENDLTV